MANGLGLEKLFSKRKAASNRDSTSGSNISGDVPPSPSPEQSEHLQFTFPPPSFIRPTRNRMAARNEFDSTPLLTIRAGSSLRPTNSQKTQRPQRTWQLSSTDCHDMDMIKRRGSLSSTISCRGPDRTSSILARRNDASLGGMVPVLLPHDKRRSVDSLTHPSQSIIFNDSPPPFPCKDTHTNFLEALAAFPTPRMDTPPPSDHDDGHSPATPEHEMLPPSLSPLTQPTPGPSPQTTPRRDSFLCDPKMTNGFPPTPGLRPSSSEIAMSRQKLLDGPISNSASQEPPKDSSQTTKAVLTNPNISDFHKLTDDDIAETKATLLSRPPRSLPPPPPIPPPSARSPPYSPVAGRVMPLSTIAHRPNEIAALEAARIATKYDFDLLYIVNFWPAHMSHLHESCVSRQTSAISSPTESIFEPHPLLSSNSSMNSTPRHSAHGIPQVNTCLDGNSESPRASLQTKINGSILAAYGLEKLEPPFCLSGPAHKKMLRTDGWIEWRQDEANDDEFARGWACSFYSGHMEDARSQSAPEIGTNERRAKIRPRRRTLNNRGIVFAAYRKPRGNGGTVHSGPAELAAVYKEAELLVEMLLDFHAAKRKQEIYDAARRASA